MNGKSRALTLAATSMLLSACSEILVDGSDTLDGSQLIFLPVRADAPATASVSLWVAANRSTTRSIRHADPFNTLFVLLEFPSGSVTAAGGVPLTGSDSARVTVSTNSGRYGITIAPDDLEFATTGGPRLQFSAAVYGDFAVHMNSTTYATAEAYLAALEIWREVSPGTWRRVPSTVDRLATSIATTISEPGRYAVAAPL